MFILYPFLVILLCYIFHVWHFLFSAVAMAVSPSRDKEKYREIEVDAAEIKKVGPCYEIKITYMSFQLIVTPN